MMLLTILVGLFNVSLNVKFKILKKKRILCCRNMNITTLAHKQLTHSNRQKALSGFEETHWTSSPSSTSPGLDPPSCLLSGTEATWLGVFMPPTPFLSSPQQWRKIRIKCSRFTSIWLVTVAAGWHVMNRGFIFHKHAVADCHNSNKKKDWKATKKITVKLLVNMISIW